MYVPRANTMDEADVRSFVAGVGAADLVTIGPAGEPLATLLPILWEGDRVLAHFARANAHWKTIADGDAVLLIVRGAEAYVSPGWYATKREHGKVVPTWNYSSVHLRGRARVVHDLDWLRDMVGRLTDVHERQQPAAWRIDDAPASYIDGMLRAIVGIEIEVEAVEAKAKLSQNRSVEDREGVIAGLTSGSDLRGEHQVARAMSKTLS